MAWAALGATGCGNKGALYLPEAPEVQPGFDPSDSDFTNPGAGDEEDEDGFGP